MALQAMNASPHHPKVKTSIRLGDALYVAGGVVAGKMQMECKADKGLGIGTIMVELYAIEELTSRDHSATSTFLHSKRVFQGPGLPPSNSVHPYPRAGDLPLPPDYYPARRGTTTFLFRFDLPPTSPSAINFGSGLANVRYELRASVGVSWKGERRLVTDKKEVDVVEKYEEEYSRGSPEGVVVGEGGKMWVQGRLVGGFLIAGQPACVELQVKNHSPKKNSGLSITLTRELRLPHFPIREKAPLRISDTLTSVSFRGPEYIVPSGTEGVANLVFDVPANSRGVNDNLRYGDEQEDRATECLFEIRCVIGIKLAMGFASKDILLDIPVVVLHPRALPEFPFSDTYHPPQSPILYNATGQILYPIPTSPAPYLVPQHDLPAMSPVDHHIDYGHLGWLSQPVQSPFYHLATSPPLHDPSAYFNMPLQIMVPPPHPHAYPLRSSSAEPIPSHALYAMPSGLPIPPIQQPLLSLTRPELPLLTDREEGKGERASRIAHHLRISSRHRSVSPQAHRYPVPGAIEGHVIGQSMYGAPPSLQVGVASLPLSVPLPSPPMQLTIPTGLSMNSDVVSPKPLHSPKQTYSVDPFTHATSTKSERVETLERIAANAERKFSDMSSNVPEVMNVEMVDKEKTLPGPPVPSGKIKITSGLTDSRPAANKLFLTVDPGEEAPPTPTLAAVASLKVPRTGGAMSGLDVLEARLLAEVGTRKVDSGDRKPDVRSILPMAIPKPRGQESSTNDSAISSLNLPGLGADEMTKIGKPSSTHSATTYRDGQRGRTRQRDRGKTQEPSDGTAKDNKRKKEKQVGPRDEEVFRLRKVAQGRIAAWLDTIDPDAPSSPVITGRSTPQEDRDDQDPSVEPHRPLSERPDDDKKATLLQHEGHRPDVIAQPNARSSGFVPISTLRAQHERSSSPSTGVSDANGVVKLPPNLHKYLPVYPPRSLDPEVRYDVRSARGGRGGKVTAVAAIWASTTQQTTSSTQAPSVPPKAPKPIHPKVKLTAEKTTQDKSLPVPNHPRTAERLPARLPSPHSANRDGAPKMSAKRAKGAKAASVPAVMSSSLAIPMLSSTASLARAPASVPDRTRFKNQVSSSITDFRDGAPAVSPNPIPALKSETAFGQARLKELIKKYQGQTNV